MTRTWLPLAAVGLATVFAGAPAAQAAIVVEDLDNGASADGIAQTLAGSGVSVSNIDYTGTDRAAGTFSGGDGIIGFGSGVILGSGNIQTVEGDDGDPLCSSGVEGPNDCFEDDPPFARPPHHAIAAGWNCQGGGCNSTDFGNPGDADLTALSTSTGGGETEDAAILEFDFVPATSAVRFSYVFSSEEYNDFANTEFNDVFAFFVNGTNCATVPGTGQPVSVNTINNGNPGGDTTPNNPQFYIDNVRPSPTLDTEMDGLTTLLTCTADVNAGQSNHLKLAIADASDARLDSAVFLQAESLVPVAPGGPPIDTGSPLGPPIPNQTVNVQAVEGTVLVKLPGADHFTPLQGASQIPVGSQLDTRNGTVQIVSASDFSGGIRTGEFYDGVFTVTQKDKGGSLITHLQLVPKIGCGTPKSGPGAQASGKKKGNGMWGSEKGGGHSTGGKKGSGSARGTIWFVGDRCNGTTLAKVKEGKVRFRDFERKKTVTLKAGDKYVAG
jgi:hypothetical protein